MYGAMAASASEQAAGNQAAGNGNANVKMA